ncbi:MAG: hypothetical protein ABI640_02300 [Gammaproteobacteria bacterium]
MQFLILSMIVAVMSFPFLTSRGVLPQVFNYAPEIVALVACVTVVIVGVRSRFRYVRPVYWLIFGALLLATVCGAVANLLEPGPLFAGIRTYLRALPFFFLPAVVLFKERQLRTQLLLLLALCAIQLPLTWAQRMGPLAIKYSHTGDVVFGTIMDSGILSVFLICAACVLTGVYLRRRISLRLYLVLMLIILVPTTLNETKATLFLVPVGLLVTFYAGSPRGTRLKNTLMGVVVLSGFLAIFVPVYDHFMAYKYNYGILDFLTMQGRVEGYLAKGTKPGEQREAGRLDGVFAAFSEFSKNPTNMVFGYGIGNASESSLGRQFVGAHHEQFANFPFTTLLNLFLEEGLFGLGLVLFLHWMIFTDSLAVARQGTGLLGALAIGWVGVTVVIIMSFPYTKLITFPAVSYLYWYFSGLIVASRMRAAENAEARGRVSANADLTQPPISYAG